MGLDSYLYATQFFAASKHKGFEETERQKEETIKVKEIANLMNGNDFLETGESFLQFAKMKLQLAYWRKANQIHKFFVDVCADGKDECQDTYVSRENLEDLLNRCKTVLEDHSKAEELLPSKGGFFFGSTDYDEWYYKDLEDTIPVLEKILKDAPESWGFEYKASW
jgi:hypothetical protein